MLSLWEFYILKVRSMTGYHFSKGLVGPGFKLNFRSINAKNSQDNKSVCVHVLFSMHSVGGGMGGCEEAANFNSAQLQRRALLSHVVGPLLPPHWAGADLLQHWISCLGSRCFSPFSSVDGLLVKKQPSHYWVNTVWNCFPNYTVLTNVITA